MQERKQVIQSSDSKFFFGEYTRIMFDIVIPTKYI